METSQPWTMESSWNARVVGPLEEQAWLDQAADYVLELAKPLLELPQADKVTLRCRIECDSWAKHGRNRSTGEHARLG